LRRVAVWRDTEATAPPLAAGPAVKERYVDVDVDVDVGPPRPELAYVGPPRPELAYVGPPRPELAYVGPPRPAELANVGAAPPVMRVELWSSDTIDAGVRLVEEGYCRRPLLLVLADDSFPGGCVTTGSGAQEESVFRRTNLFRSLDRRQYPLRDDEALYAPSIALVKRGERDASAPFAALPQPYRLLDFVACPALRHPDLTPDDRLYEADVTRLRRKVELVLQVAVRHGHDGVVLGAMGCGAWKSPPEHVAQIMRDVIRDLPNDAFRIVVVAVLQGAMPGYIQMHRDRAENYPVFARYFQEEAALVRG
jgi:uncharacterized protein (TIGR02452 family)